MKNAVDGIRSDQAVLAKLREDTDELISDGVRNDSTWEAAAGSDGVDGGCVVGMEALMSVPNVEKMSEYFKREVEACKNRLVRRGLKKGQKKKKKESSLNVEDDYPQPLPSEVTLLYSYLPKSLDTEEALQHMRMIGQAHAKAALVYYKREAWVETIDEIGNSLKYRLEEIERKLKEFPSSNLARVLRLWVDAPASESAMENLKSFGSYAEEKSEWTYLKSVAHWKLNIKTKQQKLVIQKMTKSLNRFQEMLQNAAELQKLMTEEREIIEAEIQQLKQKRSFQAVTDRAVEQLKQLVEFERKAAEKSREKAERRRAIIKQLQDRIDRDSAEIQRVEQREAMMALEVRHIKNVIRWAAIERDFAEARQGNRGYKLEGQDLDSIEISVIPKVHFNPEMHELWLNYLKSPEVQTIIEISKQPGDEENGREFDRQFAAWSLRRDKLFEELETLELKQTLADCSQKQLHALQLAVPISPRIRIWWRFDVAASQQQQQQRPLAAAGGDKTKNGDADHNVGDCCRQTEQLLLPRFYEGMKIMFSSRLSDDLTLYMPDYLRLVQPQFDVSQIECDDDEAYEEIMKKRKRSVQLFRRYVVDPSLNTTATLGSGGVLLYEWEMRRCLFNFVEERLNVNIMKEMKERGFFKPSQVNELLDDASANQSPPHIVVASFDLFAPQFPSAMITDVAALCILHVRSIEAVMEQQRELMKRFPPLGRHGGTEVTYIPKGFPRHDYRWPPIDPSEISICEEDEVVFHIDLRKRSLRNCGDFNQFDRATVLIKCNVAFSLATKSWIIGARDEQCEVLLDRQVWDLTTDELESRFDKRDYMSQTLRERIKQWKTLSRIPTSSDLRDLVCEIEAIGFNFSKNNVISFS